MKNVCVFCGSRTGRNEIFAHSAADLARKLAQRDIGIVYGGGHVGLMGVVADAALAAGGRVIGVIPQALADREVAHHGLTELHVVTSMHERKALMADLSDAFVALPGGYGTLDELCEIITWAQLGIHDRPIGLLNVDGYYDQLLALFDGAVAHDFVSPQNRTLVRDATTTDELLRRIGC